MAAGHARLSCLSSSTRSIISVTPPPSPLGGALACPAVQPQGSAPPNPVMLRHSSTASVFFLNNWNNSKWIWSNLWELPECRKLKWNLNMEFLFQKWFEVKTAAEMSRPLWRWCLKRDWTSTDDN